MNKDNQDIDLIKKYLRGQLSPAEMHRLEKRALDDPFLAEAMEGYENFPNNSHSLNELKVRLKSRTESKISKNTNTPPVNFKIWSLAACVVILIGLFSIYLNQPKQNNFSEPLTKSSPQILPPPGNAREKKTISPDIAAETSIEDMISKTEVIAANSERKKEKEDTPTADDIVVEQIARTTAAPSMIAPAVEPALTPMAKKESLAEPDAFVSLSNTNTLSTKTAKEADSIATKGKIKDLSTTKPIDGAIIKDVKTNIRVISNENGEFFFPYKVKKIAIYAKGFQSREIELGPLQEININLNPNPSSADIPVRSIRRSTVVVGPYNGWAAFRKYLDENSELESGETGHVIVEFIIKPSGELSDFRVLKSLSKLADARAIDLIKNYQNWQGASDGYSNRVKVTVRFK